MAYFLINKKKVLEQYNNIKEVSDIVSYSMKTNIDVSKILNKETNCWFSIHHIRYAKMYDPKRIIYFITGDTLKQIEKYIKLGIDKFVVDNIYDYSTIKKVIENNPEKKLTIFLRMKLKEFTIHTEKHFVFGMYSEKINELVSELSNYKNITIGIHVHRKTQNTGEWNLLEELQNNLNETTIKNIKYFCSGGGYPIVYKNYPENQENNVFIKLKELKSWLNKKGIKLITEPGRYICGPSVELHSKIISIYDDTITLDCSIYNGAMDTFVANIRLPIRNETNLGYKYTIKGKTPDSIDIFRYKVFFEKQKKVGEKIIFENAGAYNYSTNLFGLKKLPIKIIEG
jgi:ornithine decarboxylase